MAEVQSVLNTIGTLSRMAQPTIQTYFRIKKVIEIVHFLKLRNVPKAEGKALPPVNY